MEIIRVALLGIHALSSALWAGAILFTVHFFLPLAQKYQDYEFFSSLKSQLYEQTLRLLNFAFLLSLLSGGGLFVLYRRSFSEGSYLFGFSSKMALIVFSFLLLRPYLLEGEKKPLPPVVRWTGTIALLSVFFLSYALRNFL